ncbi:MAG: hypothetical protein WB821_05660 [Burkholderiaceae bacterium]
MIRILHLVALPLVALVLALGIPASAQNATPDAKPAPRSQSKDAAAEGHTPKAANDAAEPDHIRGQITKVEDSALTLKASDGRTVRIGLKADTTVISLTKASFGEVDFGTYVGTVAVKLEEYSPIVRDSAVWLHKGFELRIIDEALRGIALGHKKWDLGPDTIISHGWVDDIEIRVLSIKWGPTDYDETDVEIPRDAPINRMAIGNRDLLKSGVRVLVGAKKGVDGKYVAGFVFVGKDGVVPPL